MAAIRLIEVGPRDGLQNEQGWVPTEAKIAFVDQLSASGLLEIEVSSFVAPGWIPQLEDAEAVFAGITRGAGIRYTALVPNQRGLARAMASRPDGISVFTAASETFARKNINASIAESIERFRPVVRQSTVPVRGYISTAFHCPFEGPIAPAAVLHVALELLALGCTELSLGDTIGKATPIEVETLLRTLAPHCPVDRLALHLHDTFGNAVPNALMGAAHGITIFDGSTGGLGGCPYAPGAPGNVATEALVAAFPGRTGVDSSRLTIAARAIRPYLGRGAAVDSSQRSLS
ncbi:MAG: hydroxymethylglutaryl-CoA lyase [Gemmatimonadota bacterium]